MFNSLNRISDKTKSKRAETVNQVTGFSKSVKNTLSNSPKNTTRNQKHGKHRKAKKRHPGKSGFWKVLTFILVVLKAGNTEFVKKITNSLFPALRKIKTFCSLNSKIH